MSSWNRRTFLKYSAGSAIGTVALGWLAGCQGESVDSGQPTPARDEAGMPLTAEAVLGANAPGDFVPAQGLAEPVFLVITEEPAVAGYGLSAVCSHRQCVVDWDAAAQQFVCPCHDSRFDTTGAVAQGPATEPLGLVSVITTDEQILLSNEPPAESPQG